METEIINLLSIKKNISMNYDEIRRELGISKEDLDEALSNLERYGTIYQSKNGRYILVSRTSLKKGIVKDIGNYEKLNLSDDEWNELTGEILIRYLETE